jgi:hypothetical protein
MRLSDGLTLPDALTSARPDVGDLGRRGVAGERIAACLEPGAR